ncbi:MAG: hypothetical protein ACI9CE_002007 [Flavobacterium sp.]|jgi:hypothetical protein
MSDKPDSSRDRRDSKLTDKTKVSDRRGADRRENETLVDFERRRVDGRRYGPRRKD